MGVRGFRIGGLGFGVSSLRARGLGDRIACVTMGSGSTTLSGPLSTFVLVRSDGALQGC